jgi:GxxExxY protein
MNADTASRRLKSSDVTERAIGVFYDVYNELGFGFLEAVHARAMFLALAQAGLATAAEQPISVSFRGHSVGEYRADLVVEETVLVELKAVRDLTPAHDAQVLNYLRATSYEVGLLLNFGPRPSFRRLVFENSRKNWSRIRVYPR